MRRLEKATKTDLSTAFIDILFLLLDKIGVMIVWLTTILLYLKAELQAGEGWVEFTAVVVQITSEGGAIDYLVIGTVASCWLDRRLWGMIQGAWHALETQVGSSQEFLYFLLYVYVQQYQM